MKKRKDKKIIFLLFLLLISVVSYHQILTFFSLIVLIISVRLVWRKNEPPIFPFIIIYHWFQISTKIFHANILNIDINAISSSSSTNQAIWLSLIGLFSLSYGIHIVTKNIKFVNENTINSYGNLYSLKKLFKIYLITFVLYVLLKGIMFSIPQLTQIISGVMKFKMIIIYLFFLISFIKKEYKFMVFILIVEIVFGLFGFFSSFKEPFFLLFLAYFTITSKFTVKSFKILILPSLAIILLLMTWTAIKVDYREQINKNSQTMVVNVSASEQVGIFKDVVSEVSADDLSLAVEILALRLSYVDYFGEVIDYVPNIKPFENGKLWFGAMTNIFKPRILFPNKKGFDDSERTNKYTGNNVAGWDKGASISVGYFAESYIDFGYGMFFILFFLGMFYGVIYKVLIRRINNLPLAYAMIIAVLMFSYLFETRNDKLIGGIFTSIIVLFVLWKPLIKKYLKVNNL